MAKSLGRRRALNTLAATIGAALVGAAAFTSVALNEPGERIEHMWVGAEVRADGTAHITEVVDYVFADGPRRGIYRVVPDSGKADAANVQVTMDGAPVPFDAAATTGTLRIKIGDPDATVTGKHRYRIEYTLPELGDGGELAWDAVGDGWEVPVERAEVHLTSAVGFVIADCASGEAGEDGDCTVAQPSSGRLDATVDDLDPGEGVTFYAVRGAEVDVVPLPQAPVGVGGPVISGDGPVAGGLWAVAGALAGVVAATIAIRFAGRQRIESSDGMNRRRGLGRLTRDAVASPDPPRDLGPALAAVLYTDRVRREHQSAWLLGAALDGHLSITGKKKRPVLRRNADGPPARGLTDQVLGALFANGETVSLGRYTRNFSEAWKLIGEGLEKWRRDEGSGLWEPGGIARRRIAKWLGLGAALAGAVMVAVMATAVPELGADLRAPLVIGAAVAGAGLAAFFSAWELRVRTPRGTRLWCETEAYRRHLVALTREEWAASGDRETRTAWAIALGLATPTVVGGAASGREPAGRAAYTPETALGLHNAAVLTAVPPSSSGSWHSGSSGGYFGGSSGGGDGGGSGGGDGGGGGGSW